MDKKVFISSKNSTNLEKLLHLIEDNLPQEYREVNLKIPYDKQELVNYFF